MNTEFGRYAKLIALIIAAGFVFACGGSSNSGSSIIPPPPGSGIIGSGFTVGSIDAFKSIITGGREYDTGAATFTIEGQPGIESDLKVGHVVIIEADFNDDGLTATANSVSFDDNVEGPIDSIDTVTGTLVVLGQRVLTNGTTAFDDNITPPSIDGLMVGDVVEISGLVDSAGNIFATRIEAKAAGGEFEVVGVVSNLDAGMMMFDINALIVDYSMAMLVNFPSGMPANGDIVEVKGSMFGGGGELLATEVELKAGGLPVNEDDLVEIEGFITRFVSAIDFDVGGIPVTTNASTDFEDGTAADLALDVRVEVEGTIDSTGVLVASEVEFEQDSSVRAATTVDNVNAAMGELTIFGSITVQVTPETRMEDKRDDVRPFAINDIVAGDFVRVRGFEAAPGTPVITATLLERDDLETESELQGFVEAVNDPEFTILGITIQTNAGTVFEDENDNIITAAQFFAQAFGRLAKAEGTLSGAVLVADEVELED